MGMLAQQPTASERRQLLYAMDQSELDALLDNFGRCRRAAVATVAVNPDIHVPTTQATAAWSQYYRESLGYR